ncbi:hypothetical protein CVT24_010304 [Panaeolus cyanescens]|uniref:Uncharacterized protein n=1 Tax=Panaeolus cyanescens TaxID=181874 RepID=A0A409YQB8_9AGAR|nr:hypothetical protein CVT24_010304 [Panaeolus cyanescens]
MPHASLEAAKSHYTLSMVCRRWSQLAHVAYIPFTIYEVRYTGPDQSVEETRPEFDTAVESFALRIHIPDVHKLIDDPVACSYSSPITHLSLSYAAVYDCSFVNSIIPNSWFNLQTLKLFISYHVDTMDTQIVSLENAPFLTDIEIEAEVHFRFAHSLTNVKRYKEHCLDPVIFLYSMQHATAMEQLVYTI